MAFWGHKFVWGDLNVKCLLQAHTFEHLIPPASTVSGGGATPEEVSHWGRGGNFRSVPCVLTVDTT